MTKSAVVNKPVPVVSEWAKPFWQGTDQGKLVLQRCNECTQYIFYPRLLCPHCSSDDVCWQQVSGKGKVYSYTVVQNNAPSAFVADMPYVVAVIELDEGVRMLSNVVECEPDDLVCDMPVTVVFERLDENFVLPKFRPI